MSNRSPVNGRIRSVEVVEGQTVKSKDLIYILESMKIEISIYANSKGRITSLFFEQGDSVKEGELLFEVDHL